MGRAWALAAADLHLHFVNSVILSAFVSLFVLWRYRLAVLRAMGEGEGAALALPPPEACRPDGPRVEWPVFQRWEQAKEWRLALAWWLTTLTCGLPLAAGYGLLSQSGFSLAQVFLLALCFSLVAIPMVRVSLAWPPARLCKALLLFTLLVLLLALLVGAIQRMLAGLPLNWTLLRLLPLFLRMAANQLWMPMLFWGLTWPARVRGVAPITLAGLVLFGLAPVLGAQLTGVLAATEVGTPIAFSLGQSGLFVMLALPAGWIAWWRLRRLAAAHGAKRLSDAQLLAVTWWLFLVVSVGAELLMARDHPLATLLLCAGVLLAFLPVNRWWLALLLRSLEPMPPRTLLLLRVFGHTARTERLFDRIGARWRLFGPVLMIAAPDVVARTITPGDYLRWLTGRLGSLFVTSKAELEARLASIDGTPDPDGRYRVTTFCCHANSWEATVVELMDRADAVVMDLRGLTPARQGCAFELQQLKQRLPPQRVVLVTDSSTDEGWLAATLGEDGANLRRVTLNRSERTGALFSAVRQAAC
ncbi:MAG: hypothetical protein RLZZ117_1974 [Cyanobacteriota bacterium]